jgi:hypothetical protein
VQGARAGDTISLVGQRTEPLAQLAFAVLLFLNRKLAEARELPDRFRRNQKHGQNGSSAKDFIGDLTAEEWRELRVELDRKQRRQA